MDGAIIKNSVFSEKDGEDPKNTKWKQEGVFKWY
jgi:hypothetical protein